MATAVNFVVIQFEGGGLSDGLYVAQNNSKIF